MGLALATFYSLQNSLIRAKNRFVKNGTENFGRNIPTEVSGPFPEVIPNIPVRRNRDGLFHLNSDRHFRYLWHNGRHHRFLGPSGFLNLPITQTKNSFPSSVDLYNFTPDLSDFSNQFSFPWRFVKSGFHCMYSRLNPSRNSRGTLRVRFTDIAHYSSRPTVSQLKMSPPIPNLF